MRKFTPAGSHRVLIAAGGIYTAQSLVGGLTFLGVPAVLRSQNVALDQIGLVSLAMLVWAMKFLWATPVERWRMGVNGARRSRPLILAGEAIVVLALLAFGMAAGANFSVILALLIVMAVASATVDIACDAFLIEQFPAERRGLANVAQVGGGYLGMIAGSGLFVAAYAHFGWTVASLLLAGLVILLCIPMAGVREAAGQPTTQLSKPALLNGLKRQPIRIGIALTILFELGGRLAQALSGPFLIDAGLSLATLGILNGTGGVAAGLAGTLAGGWLSQRLGAGRAMFIVACLQAVTLAALALAITLQAGNPPLLVGLFVVESAVMAAGFVTSYARLMALTSPSQPGIDFTLFQCASAIAATLCGISAGMIAARTGYEALFGLAALMAFATPFILILLEHRLSKGQAS